MFLKVDNVSMILFDYEQLEIFLFEIVKIFLFNLLFSKPSYAQNGSPGTQTLYFWQPGLPEKYQKVQILCIPPLLY